MPGETAWRLTPPPAEGERHQIVLYLGCNVFRTSHMIQTVNAIFDRLGVDYVAVGGPTFCCGIVHHQHGDTAAAGGMSRHTLDLFARYAPSEVVMWCPSCIHFYDEVQGMALPWPIRHLAEYLVAQLPRLTFTSRLPARVALHAHAASPARRREGEAGRQLLAAVPGVELVPLAPEPRFGRSCSPAVQEAVGGVVTWEALVRAETERARAGDADTLATMYHGCQRMLCAFELESGLAIEHYLSVFARGLGIAFEDTYKKYRQWADADR